MELNNNVKQNNAMIDGFTGDSHGHFSYFSQQLSHDTLTYNICANVPVLPLSKLYLIYFICYFFSHKFAS